MVCKYMSDDAVTIMIFMKKTNEKRNSADIRKSSC